MAPSTCVTERRQAVLSVDALRPAASDLYFFIFLSSFLLEGLVNCLSHELTNSGVMLSCIHLKSFMGLFRKRDNQSSHPRCTSLLSAGLLRHTVFIAEDDYAVNHHYTYMSVN
jgi:hypothetical protein